MDLADIVLPNDSIFISVITYMEALGYAFESDKEESIINSLCENLNVISLDDQIIQKVIEIRKTNRIKLPDAIIYATAFVHNLTLITRNTSDFKTFKDSILILDPFDSKH